MRTLMRGESLSSTKGSNLASSLEGVSQQCVQPRNGSIYCLLEQLADKASRITQDRAKGTAGISRVPTVVDLADIKLDGQRPSDMSEHLPITQMSAAIHNFPVKDDALPMPKVNAALDQLMKRQRRVSWREKAGQGAVFDADPSTPVVGATLLAAESPCAAFRQSSPPRVCHSG